MAGTIPGKGLDAGPLSISEQLAVTLLLRPPAGGSGLTPGLYLRNPPIQLRHSVFKVHNRLSKANTLLPGKGQILKGAIMNQETSITNMRLLFYKDCINDFIKNKNASILVIGGGKNDRLVFQQNGFIDVTISNIDERQNDSEYYPYKHCFQNAENLSYQDNEFDYVTTHATLHHCSSPHRAMTEMYRVAKKGVVVIESRDSWLMRLLIKLNITPAFETAAIYDHNCKYGGVNNTCIPNYIYRWTEHEVEKTIKSYAPFVKHKFIYRYGLDEPSATKRSKSWSKKIIINILSPIYVLVVKIFPRQQNLFACFIAKPVIPDDLQPWIKFEDGVMSFNEPWAAERIKTGPGKKK